MTTDTLEAPVAPSRAPAPRRADPRRTRNGTRTFLPQLMVSPAVAIITLLSLLPLVYGVWLSLTDWSLMESATPEFEGIAAYREMLADAEFWDSVLRSAWWTIGTLVIELATAIPLALLLNRRTPVSGVVTSLILLPWVTPFVVLAYAWLYLYDGTFGIFHHVLEALHIVGEASPLSEPSQALWAIVLISGWKGMPFLTIALLAVLKGIPGEQYEAAQVDGATKWQRFRYITFPSLTATLAAMCFVLGVQAFYSFDLVWLTTKGGPGKASELAGLDLFRTFFVEQRPGYAAALGTALLILLAVAGLLALAVVRLRAHHESTSRRSR